jgi:Kdo2-lipid IVA lauroyltransferase/acyltransferase
MSDTRSAGKRFVHWLEYAGVRFIFSLFRFIGRRRASTFGAWLAKKVGPRLKAHQVAIKNLKIAFPDKSTEEYKVILEGMWDNLGRNIGELPFNREVNFDQPYIDVEGIEHLDAFVQSGEAGLFVAAHYGPWELAIAACGYCQKDIRVVYRTANNPLVEDYFQRERFVDGCVFIPKGKNGARELLKALKSKTGVAILNDQKQNTGVPVPFFGRDAMTATALADLAVRSSLPIIPLQAIRLEDGRAKITIMPPMNVTLSGSRNDDVMNLLKQVNELYEEWIRERPDHWFWVHNRWPDQNEDV